MWTEASEAGQRSLLTDQGCAIQAPTLRRSREERTGDREWGWGVAGGGFFWKPPYHTPSSAFWELP